MYEEIEPDMLMRRLKAALALLPKVQVKQVVSSERYLRVEIADETLKTVDDVEFYLTPGDNTVQFRAARRDSLPDFGVNRRRLESIRIALGLEKVPVLRYRRTIFPWESPLDQFGPSMAKTIWDKMDAAEIRVPPEVVNRDVIKEGLGRPIEK